VGRAVARQPGAGGVAHPERIAPRELHLLAKSKLAPPMLSPSHGQLRAFAINGTRFIMPTGPQREPEQHADPAGEQHRRVGLAGGVRAGRHPGGERGDERRGPVRHPAPSVGLHHPPRRPARRVHQLILHGRRRVAGDSDIPDPGEQPAVVEAERRVGGHGQQPHQHHSGAN
jgi:hypothetical protein